MPPMPPLLERTAQEKRNKSRSGCKACKDRRIKCDETKPECHQCTRRKVECPGYIPTLKWSKKYERLGAEFDFMSLPRKKQPRGSSVKVRSPVLVSPSATASTSPNADGIATLTKPATAIAATGDDGDEPTPPTREFDEPDSSSDSYINPAAVGIRSPAISHASPASLHIDCFDSTNTPPQIEKLDFSSTLDPCPTTDLVLNSPSLELHYFSQSVCTCLCACDSITNPFRAVPISKIRSSQLYQSLLKYIIGAYMSMASLTDTSQFLLREAQIDTLFYLEQQINAITQGERKTLEDSLLAIIMYGLTISWDGSNNTGSQHYEAAVSLYQQGSGMPSKNRQFFSETLAYWWCGLAFSTDPESEILSDPPCMDGSLDDQRGVHPLTGVSAQPHMLLGQVGSLLKAQRSLALKRGFTLKKHIEQAHKALDTAQWLEEQLLSLQTPMTEEIAETDDTNTSADDLCNTSEAFRLAALLLLYRGFPDLLEERMTNAPDQCPADVWLTSLAIHILDLLSQNGVRSGTRSIEQILLVIIAGELCAPKASTSSRPLVHNFLSLPTLSPRSETLIEREYLDSGHEITKRTVHQNRGKLLQRLAAVRNILPYKSVEQVEDLIWETWRRNDFGEEVFWMDIMIQNGWKFVMA